MSWAPLRKERVTRDGFGVSEGAEAFCSPSRRATMPGMAAAPPYPHCTVAVSLSPVGAVWSPPPISSDEARLGVLQPVARAAAARGSRDRYRRRHPVAADMTRRCPVCGAEAEQLWRSNDISEVGVCAVCNDARMEIREITFERLEEADNLTERRFVRKMANTFLGGCPT